MKAFPMDWNQRLSGSFMRCVAPAKALAVISLVGGVMAPIATAQVRSKRPDRGTYQAPRLEPVELEELPGVARAGSNESDDRINAKPASSRLRNRAKHPQEPSQLQTVGHEDVELLAPEGQLHGFPAPIINGGDDHDHAGNEVSMTASQEVIFEHSPLECDVLGCDASGCDVLGCDTPGCDSCGIGHSINGHGWANSRLSLSPSQWFGSAELLLMFRRGDRPPTLVTTGPDEANADAIVLVGGDTILEELTAGGRLTLGTWIDHSRQRSLVFRGWAAGEEDFSFNADQNSNPVLGRPFFNVTDGETPADDVNLIASPGVTDGSVRVDASSNVFGADVSVRQRWWSGLGGTIDLLYGYQYTRLTEDLRISSSATALAGSPAPLGSIIDITDDFDTENDFHGGQLGIASHYREGCWSFNTLAKVGFGSLRRQATRTGSTVTTIDGASAVSPLGLLVRGSNSGVTTDTTFGWVPELSLSIGYQRYKNWDLTFGYQIVAITDALQTAGAIDPTLASNLADPALGTQSPSPSLRFDTFYVQGIHFGIQYVR